MHTAKVFGKEEDAALGMLLRNEDMIKGRTSMMDSVVKSVANLNLCSYSPTAIDVDTCMPSCWSYTHNSISNCRDRDDATYSTWNESTTSSSPSSSRMSSRETSPVSSRYKLGPSTKPSTEVPSLQENAAPVFTSAKCLNPPSHPSSDELRAPPNAISSLQQHDRSKKIDGHDSRDNSLSNQEEDEDIVVDDPPLEAQTSYARQQLYQSSRYHELQIRKYCSEDELLDEVEISRGLGGYEEGFGIYDFPSYHEMPSTILEEDDERSSILSSSTASRSAAKTEGETLTGGSTSNKEGEASVGGSCHSGSVCLYCRLGTCDNEDCSNSRFMI